MKAYAPEPASSVNPQTWSSFDAAVDAVAKGLYENIGFVFNNNELVGIDIDTGYDEDGFISPVAADIIGLCHSYTERSRSGRGFHILVRGRLPFKGKNNLKGVEIYSASRYFIMTGDVLIYDKLIDNQRAINAILEAHFPESLRNNDKPVNGRIYVPQWEKPSDGKIRLRPVYPRIPNGCRNICLTSLAGMLHNQGYSRDQIYDELVYCNAIACDPSLDRGEILTIVNSVTRYKR